jgi:hypothetical protein
VQCENGGTGQKKVKQLGDKEVPIHTYASSLSGDTSSKVLAFRLSHLVDGSRLEAIEFAKGRSLQRKTWIKNLANESR